MNKSVRITAEKWGWPRWNWRDSGWWFTISGAVFSVLAFVYPSLPRRPLRIRLIIAVGAFVASGALSLLLAHLIHVLRVAWGRLQAYQDLSDLVERSQEELRLSEEQRGREAAQFQETILSLLTQSGVKRIEMERSQYYDETLYIVLKKRRGIVMEVGHKVSVIDMETGNVMGAFEVTEERDKQYWARSVGTVDAIWLGYVRQSGNNEPPPNTATFWMQGGGEGNG